MSQIIKSTLFECLGISDVERIHTQMLAWIFCQDNSIIDNHSKSLVLNGLFKTEGFYEQFKIETEFRNIDLLIETESCIFVLENKLKSSERPNQTLDYEKVIINSRGKDKLKYHFCFLTLISERAQSDNWVNVSYSTLSNLLKSNIKIDTSLKESYFIKEYIDTLENLSKVYNDFSRHPMRYINVFNDGSKKKYDKDKYNNPFQDYIRQNQLETIFQKSYLKKLIEEINVEELLKEIDGSSFEVSETRGIALIQLHLNLISYNGNDYRIGFQLQGNSMKINLADKNYKQSKSNQIDQRLIDEFTKHFKIGNDFSRINKPRTKAYISTSKKLDKKIWEFSLEDLSQRIKNEIKSVIKRAATFKIP